MVLADYELGDAILTALWIFFLVIWLWILIAIISDLFRDHTVSAWAKVLWVIALLFVPFLTALIYIIVRGHGMAERNAKEMKQAQQQMDDYIRQTQTPGLSFLPAGVWDTAALQNLARDRGPALLRALEDQFDFVIIDSAPVLPVADSLLIAQHVDGVLLSLLRDVSRADAVLATRERLHQLGVRVVGAVVNGMAGDVRAANYRYPSPRAEVQRRPRQR